jgi:hypothetical protein
MVDSSKITDAEGKFSPVNGRFINILLSFLYFLVISIPICAIVYFPMYYPASMLPSYFLGVIVNLFSGLLLLSLAFLFAITIHKSLVKSLLTTLGIMVIFFFLFGFWFMQLIKIVPITIMIALLLGYFCRFFYRIESKKMKLTLLLIPILIVCIAVSIVVVNANNNLSISVCDNMPGTPFKDTAGTEKLKCYSMVGEKGNNILACSKIVQLDCITNAAKNIVANGNLDVLICEQLSDTQQKSFCYWGIAKAVNNASLCNNVIDNKEMCYSNIAESMGGVESCYAIIGNNFTRKECFTKVAIKLNQPELCQNIAIDYDGGYDRDECYTSVAVENKDSTGCSNVLGETYRSMCYQNSAK